MFYEVIPWMDESQCDKHPNWNCNLPYGSGMVIRTLKPESFHYFRQWTQIDQEIQLNDPNGYIRIWCRLVVDESNISITTGGAVHRNFVSCPVFDLICLKDLQDQVSNF